MFLHFRVLSFGLTRRMAGQGASSGKLWLVDARRSEEDEDLLDVTLDVLHLLADDVEADGLREGAALADGHDITGGDTEGGGAVSRDSVMALLEPVILLDVVQVIAADDDGSLHFSRDDNAPNQRQNRSAIV